MDSKAAFSIEGKRFFLPEIPDGTSLDFIVQSVPDPYQVCFDDAFLPSRLEKFFARFPDSPLLIDRRVGELHFPEIMSGKPGVFSASATEDFKTLDGMIEFIAFLEKCGMTKGHKLLVIGGGIIQDVGAFVARCFKRGIPWEYWPTTLLSMCDSCIGGKTGINHNRVKNQLALFSAPTSVMVNPRFLTTLEPAHIFSGLGEIAKLCLTGGDFCWKFFKDRFSESLTGNVNVVSPLIHISLLVKKLVVEADEFEKDLRKSLNYGHTLGHALETVTDFALPHGQAVILGMLLANELSSRLGFLPQEENEEIFSVLKRIPLKGALSNIPVGKMVDLVRKDKKSSKNTVTFVFLQNIGKIIFHKLEIDGQFEKELESVLSHVEGKL